MSSASSRARTSPRCRRRSPRCLEHEQLMRRFQYHEPATLDEAVALLSASNAQILAGGTDLLVELKEQLRRADCVINIKKIPGLAGLAYDGKAGLRIGALATAREVE